MNVLLLSYEYPPETGFGGIGTYTWYHARALARLGHRVHVLAGATEPTPLRTYEHDGVTVFRFRNGSRAAAMIRGQLGRMRLWWTRSRLENAHAMLRGVRALQTQYQYDVIEMPECGGEGMLLNTRVRTPRVVRLHSPARLIMPYYDVRPLDITLCSAAEMHGIRTADALTACSRFMADEARKKLAIDEPITVIPNGIDLRLFDSEEPIDFRSRFDLPQDRPIVFFAGRMEARKGVHLCARIAADVLERYDVAFVMAGDDLFGHVTRTLRPELERRRLRGSFHYLGRLSLDEVRAGVRACDVFLLPSLWENCPYSCLEAMAAGRAIVGSDQGGIPELIKDGENGMLSPAGDPSGFAGRLGTLIEDSCLRARLGRNARRTVEEDLTDERIAALSLENYERVVRSAA